MCDHLGTTRAVRIGRDSDLLPAYGHPGQHAETRRMCGMRKSEWMHKRSENGTRAGIAVSFLCLKVLKHKHIQRHTQSNTFKRYAVMMGI